MERTRKLFTAILVLCAFLIVGCGGNKEQAKSTATGSYTIVDAQGTKVTIAKKPTRILAQSMTLDSLILGLVPADRLVAKCYLDDLEDSSFIYKDVKNIKTTLRSFTSIPTETALQLKPDIVFFPITAKPEMVTAFRDLGFNVVVCKTPSTVEDVKYNVKLVAQALQEETAGNKVIEIMDRDLKEIKEVVQQQNKKKPVAMLVSRMTNYGGKGSMFDEICNQAGVINGIAAVGIHSGEKLTKELVVKADPDFFIVSKTKPVSQAKPDSKASAEEFKQEFLSDKALIGMRALEHIHAVPNKYLYTNSQNCIWAIKGIANLAYGPIFDMKDEGLIKGY